MSGHSKWSKVKHQKEFTDAAKAKVFTKMANAITIAVREGGGPDPDSNFKLRLAMEKARESNMPKDKIERAIERASGIGGGNQLEQTVYEVIGPGGVGIIVEATTDNRQRTVALLKSLVDKNGGVVASSGAVAHMFSYLGRISSSADADSLMESAIAAGAQDLQASGEGSEIYTAPHDLHKVKQALLDAGIQVTEAELVYHPTMTIAVSEKETANQLVHLLNLIEELDDIQHVYANVEMPDEFFE